EPLTLTAIRSLGISTSQQARAVVDHLVLQQLLDKLSDTQYQVRKEIRQRFAREVETPAGDQVGTKSGPSRDQVGTMSGLSAEQHTVLMRLEDEHDIATLMEWAGRSNRSKFRE